MKKFLRIMSLFILVAMLMTAILAGCGTKENAVDTTSASTAGSETTAAPTTSTEPAIDTSEAVVIKGYLLGDPPPAMQEVEDKLNEMLKKDINATMDVTHIGWGEYPTKYPLVLASGEPFDFAFSAFWTNYPVYAAKNAFMEIDMDMVKKYMPLHYAAVPESGWGDCLVNGKLYMIPQSFKEQYTYGSLIRGDLRKKYGVPEIKRMADLEVYFEAIKKNEPGMIPFNASQGDSTQLVSRYVFEDSGYSLYPISGTGFSFDLDDPSYSVKGNFDEPMASSYLKALNWVKGLYDKGYLPKNPFSNQTNGNTEILEGKTAITFNNSDSVASYFVTAKEKGIELEFIPNLSPKGTAVVRPQNGNGIALSANSPNPERTLMAFDLIMEEPSYNYLVNFGVEGVHYVVKDGKIALPEGVTSEKNPYPLHSGGYYFSNRDIWLPLPVPLLKLFV